MSICVCVCVLCLFIFKRFSLDFHWVIMILYIVNLKCKTRVLDEEDAGHKTGNNLLSYNSEVVLPSAIEGLTSVFEMETCVSLHL